jgi:hypothetical protein
MLILNRFQISLAAMAVIASTSFALAIDLTREQQLGQTNLNNSQQYTAYPGARTRLCPLVKWKDNRSVASVVACELDHKPL